MDETEEQLQEEMLELLERQVEAIERIAEELYLRRLSS